MLVSPWVCGLARFFFMCLNDADSGLRAPGERGTLFPTNAAAALAARLVSIIAEPPPAGAAGFFAGAAGAAGEEVSVFFLAAPEDVCFLAMWVMILVSLIGP